MQNHGFLASINGVVSLALLYKIPLLLLISYRGHSGDKDPWQAEGGLVTEPVLDALGIPYEVVDEPVRVETTLKDALAWTGSTFPSYGCAFDAQIDVEGLERATDRLFALCL